MYCCWCYCFLIIYVSYPREQCFRIYIKFYSSFSVWFSPFAQLLYSSHRIYWIELFIIFSKIDDIQRRFCTLLCCVPFFFLHCALWFTYPRMWSGLIKTIQHNKILLNRQYSPFWHKLHSIYIYTMLFLLISFHFFS